MWWAAGVLSSPQPGGQGGKRRAMTGADEGHADAVTGFPAEAIERDADGRLVLVGEDGRRLDAVDEVIVLTGFRPDLSLLGELRLCLDECLQAPVELAPLIDHDQHSCGIVYPYGHRDLSHSEQGVYLVGMTSYGRAPTFPAKTGYEQVRSVAGRRSPSSAASPPRTAWNSPARDRSVRRRRAARRAQEADGGGCAPALQLVQPGAPAAGRGGCRADPGGRLQRLVTDPGTPARGAAAGTGDRSRPRAALPALCATQVVSQGIVTYAFPVLNPHITASTGRPG